MPARQGICVVKDCHPTLALRTQEPRPASAEGALCPSQADNAITDAAIAPRIADFCGLGVGFEHATPVPVSDVDQMLPELMRRAATATLPCHSKSLTQSKSFGKSGCRSSLRNLHISGNSLIREGDCAVDDGAERISGVLFLKVRQVRQDRRCDIEVDPPPAFPEIRKMPAAYCFGSIHGRLHV